MYAARILLVVVFGILSPFIIGYMVVQHDEFTCEEMFGFAFLAFVSALAAGLLVSL